MTGRRSRTVRFKPAGVLAGILTGVILAACKPATEGIEMVSQPSDGLYRFSETAEILVTSEAGDTLAPAANAAFRPGAYDKFRPDKAK